MYRLTPILISLPSPPLSSPLLPSLSSPSPPPVRYLDRLLDTPVWHRDAISYLIDLLENNDQCVRSGACLALGRVKGVEAIPQLKYLAKVDFAQVQMCATKALGQLGEGVRGGGVSEGVGVRLWGE